MRDNQLREDVEASRAQSLDGVTIEYLGFIQNVINRMAGVSATFKGLSVTVFAGDLAIASVGPVINRIGIMVVGLIAMAVLGLFDMFYLRQEKQYRELYEDVRLGRHVPDFDLSTKNCKQPSMYFCFVSWSILPFYSLLIGSMVLIIHLVRLGIV